MVWWSQNLEPDDWKYVMWSHESSFTLFPTWGRVEVWRTPTVAHNSECLVPAAIYGGGSVTIWTAIWWYSAGPVSTLNGRIAAGDCVGSLGNQVPPMVQILLPNNDANFQKMTFRPYTQPDVFSLGLRSKKMHFNTFPGQHNRRTSISSKHCGQF